MGWREDSVCLGGAFLEGQKMDMVRTAYVGVEHCWKDQKMDMVRTAYVGVERCWKNRKMDMVKTAFHWG